MVLGDISFLSFLYALILILLIALLIYAFYFYQVHIRIYCYVLGLPAPAFKIKIDRNFLIPMSDGTLLTSDVFRPKKEERFPVIILRTPYGKDNRDHTYPEIASVFASQGYVVIIQDVRGRYGSEGDYTPFINEERDGKDTLAFIQEQSFCSGSMALFGFSYLGSSAWLAAPAQISGLKTMIPMFCCQNAYTGWFDKGVPYLKDIIYWLSKHQGRHEGDVTHEEVDLTIMQLPVLQFDKRLQGGMETFKTWMSHLQPDEYWKAISVSHRRERIIIPILYVAGWFDRFLNNTIEDFLEARRLSKTTLHQASKLIIGPWSHQPGLHFPGINYGYKALFRNQMKYFLKWFDFYLKDNASVDLGSFMVRYFMMGKNEWREGDSWPPRDSRAKILYLTSGGKANTFFGDGSLSFEPVKISGKDSFTYDPENPCPSVGNNMIYGNRTEGPRNQRILYERQDVLFYASPKMQGDFEIAGPVTLVLYVSSSAMDTDFVGKLIDIHPGGDSHFLVSGYVRMRFLDSVRATHGIERGKIYRVEINLGHIAHAFLKNHRIGLEITSSDFPNHGRNLNTGGSNEGDTNEIKAYQTVHHGGIYSSFIEIPYLEPKAHEPSKKRAFKAFFESLLSTRSL